MAIRFAPWLLALVVSCTAAMAHAADVAIGAFFGAWQGNAISENEQSSYFQVTARDLDVQIASAPDGGFTISWTTIQRQKGNTANPTAVNKTTSMTFAPGGERNVWRAVDSQEPLRGVYAWATIRERTLIVNTMQIDAKGGWELQSYARTLTAEGMQLRFSRFKDGEQVRTARGRLVKVAR